MKTEDEIKSKLQDVEAHILNMDEAERHAENKKDKEIYREAFIQATGQGQALKWVLNMDKK